MEGEEEKERERERENRERVRGKNPRDDAKATDICTLQTCISTN